MRARIAKWLSIAALLLATVFWNSAASYQIALNLLVCTAAAVVVVEAVEAKKYCWAAGFVALGLLFNPAVPVFQASGDSSLLLVVLSIVPFAMSLAALKPQPRPSIPSITDRNPGSQSL